MIEPDGRARCGYKWCGKLFKAPEFVKKHLRTKHESLAADVTIQCAKPYMWDRYCSECIYDRPLPSIPVETAYDVEYRTVKDILHRCSNAANIHTVVKINNNTNNNNNQQKSHFNNRDRDRDRGDNRNDRGHTNNRDNNYNNRDSRNKSDRGGDRNNRRNSGTGTGSGTGSNNSNSITNTPNTNTNDNPNKRNLTSYTDGDAPQV